MAGFLIFLARKTFTLNKFLCTGYQHSAIQ